MCVWVVYLCMDCVRVYGLYVCVYRLCVCVCVRVYMRVETQLESAILFFVHRCLWLLHICMSWPISNTVYIIIMIYILITTFVTIYTLLIHSHVYFVCKGVCLFLCCVCIHWHTQTPTHARTRRHTDKLHNRFVSLKQTP